MTASSDEAVASKSVRIDVGARMRKLGSDYLLPKRLLRRGGEIFLHRFAPGSPKAFKWGQLGTLFILI